MMEQFRREEEEARGVDDDVDLEVVEDDVVKPAIDSGPIPPEEISVILKEEGKDSSTPAAGISADPTVSSGNEETSVSTGKQTSTTTATPSSATQSEASTNTDSAYAANATSIASAGQVEPEPEQRGSEVSISSGNKPSQATTVVENITSTVSQSTVSDAAKTPSSAADVRDKSISNQVGSDQVPGKGRGSKAVNNTVASVQSTPQRPSGTQPTPPTPSTQESFFKSIHKRLLYLEANSTLSLQYIEEQSRILRDAFVKVEKRQLAKTETFLDHLNSTVMQELRSFRTMYDQLWQSTVIEIESMKAHQHSEMSELGSRLSLMADELVWQKRMAVVQSTLLLLCLGLVLFVRSGTLGSNASNDIPIVQQLGNKYSSFFESSPPRSSDTGLARRRRTLKDMWRSDTSINLSDLHSDGPTAMSDAEVDGSRSPVNIEYSPPTPESPAALATHDLRNGILDGDANYDNDTDDVADANEQDIDADTAARLEVLETQSGPATPNGTRDQRPSWEEVDRAIDALRAVENDDDEYDESPSTSKQNMDATTISTNASSPSNDPSRNLQPQLQPHPYAPSKPQPKPSTTKRDREREAREVRKKNSNKKNMRSPLRRAHSSFEESMPPLTTTMAATVTEGRNDQQAGRNMAEGSRTTTVDSGE